MKNNKKLIYNCNIFIEKSFKNYSLLINDNVIEKIITTNIDLDLYKDCEKIDCENGFVSYGFIDPHVHFRTPGNENKEDWDSGSKAALKGGFTFVIDMPNNTPPAVTFEILSDKNEIAKKYSFVNYGFYIGLTDENSNSILYTINKCRLNGINIYGIKAFLGSSTGNLLVKNVDSIKNALETGEVVLFHAEDEGVLKNIPYKGNIQHGFSRPEEAEVSAINKIAMSASDIISKSKIYICHVSSSSGLKKILSLRDKGYNIIAEVTPHHLYFTLENIEDSDPIYKVNPPIRNDMSVKALREGFNKGDINIVGTDHAPHLVSEKMSKAPPSGFPGLETAFYALYNLSKNGLIDFVKIFEYMTVGYKIFNIKKRGKIKEGNFADLVILKHKDFTFDSTKGSSKAKFSPYNGIMSDLLIDTVLINGKTILKDGKINGAKNEF